jgi:hypothetical protein
MRTYNKWEQLLQYNSVLDILYNLEIKKLSEEDLDA